MRNTLTIVGSFTPTRLPFDTNRQDCDIWVFNEAINAAWCKRADTVFQLHDRVIWSNPLNRNDPNHVLWMKNVNGACNACMGKGCPSCRNGVYTPRADRLNTTVYMQEACADVPNSKAYPLQGVKEMFGGDHFLSSSVSMALALAVYLGCYKRVEIYGVGMKTDTEYKFQREGVAYWLGIMRGVGIEVHFEGDTFACPVYGYDGEVAIPYERFSERIERLQIEVDKLTDEYAKQRVIVNNIVGEMERDGSHAVQQRLMDNIRALSNIAGNLGMVNGAQQENERYQKRADVMRAESGNEFVFSRQEFETSLHNASKKMTAAETEYISVATTLGHIERNALQAAKGSPKRAKLFDLYRQTMQQYFAAENRRAIFQGVVGENRAYLEYLDGRITAAGGAKSEAVMLEAMSHELV